MALVPLIQPPIMRALTSEKERKIRMVQLRTVSKREKILFPVVLLLLVALLLPGMFCFGNLMRESGGGASERHGAERLINIVTIFLGLSVGAKLVADKLLQLPMAARVSNKVGLESDPQNFLLMHAMGPNVAGVIGSAIAAGVMLKYVLAM